MVLIVTSSLIAQDQPANTAAAPGCGAAKSSFEVKTDSEKHPVTQPEPGKALLYFIEDDTNYLSIPKPTTRLGVDGNWVGANHGNSYFYLSVEPGERHLCASWQSRVALGAGRQTAAAHFSAEAGKAYYFRVQNYWSQTTVVNIEFGPVDSDQALLLMSKFAFSTFHPKK
jgi:hypothetical protein